MNKSGIYRHRGYAGLLITGGMVMALMLALLVWGGLVSAQTTQTSVSGTIQSVNTADGTVTIALAGGGTATFKVTSDTVISIDGSAALLADLTARIGAQVTVTSVPGQPGVAQNVSVETPPDFVTGGGWITGTPSTKLANFGVGGGIKRGQLWGHLNYVDHGDGKHVKGTGVTAYTGACGTTIRHIEGTATVNGATGFKYAVDVDDKGEPGRNDTFALKVFDGSGTLIYSASGNLGGSRPGGGNIQLHKGC